MRTVDAMMVEKRIVTGVRSSYIFQEDVRIDYFASYSVDEKWTVFKAAFCEYEVPTGNSLHLLTMKSCGFFCIFGSALVIAVISLVFGQPQTTIQSF